jgi:hypothetical protein
MSRRISLHPGGLRSVVEPALTEVVEEVFDPDASKASNEPFQVVNSDGYEDLLVVDLKALLEERDLTIDGKKADLILRLRQDDGAQSDSTLTPADALVEEEEIGPAQAAPIEQPKEANVSESEESGRKKPIVE